MYLHYTDEWHQNHARSLNPQPKYLHAGVPGDRLELNAQLAASLGAPVLMALDAHTGQSAEAIARSATIARNTVADGGADVLGLVVNRVRSAAASAAPW